MCSHLSHWTGIDSSSFEDDFPNFRIESRSDHIATQCDQCYCSSVATFGSCVCQARNDTSGDSRVEHMLYTQEYDCHGMCDQRTRDDGQGTKDMQNVRTMNGSSVAVQRYVHETTLNLGAARHSGHQ